MKNLMDIYSISFKISSAKLVSGVERVDEEGEHAEQPPFRFKDGDLAPVSVAFEEHELREKLRKVRARWDPAAKLWLVPYRSIRGTELEEKIPEEFRNGSRRL